MESPFTSLLNTNDVPPESNVAQIKEIIASRKQVVAGLDEGIQAMRNALRALEESRAVHIRDIEQHEALLSPIKRLPVDILSTIFLGCQRRKQPVQYFGSRVSNMTNEHPAVVLSHVCRRWRDVVLSTPLLWAKIDIYAPSYPSMRSMNPEFPGSYRSVWHQGEFKKRVERWEQSMGQLKETTETWLARSANCPLTLRFRFHENFTTFPSLPAVIQTEVKDVTYEKLRPIVDMLCESSTRWRNVSLEVAVGAKDSPLFRLFSHPHENIPLLRHFSFTVLFEQRASEAQADLATLRNTFLPSVTQFTAPSLRSLRLCSLWTPYVRVPVDWANLTKLELLGYNIGTGPGVLLDEIEQQPFRAQHALEILRLCPNLRECVLLLQQRLGLHFGEEEDAQLQSGIVYDQVSLPFLHTLELRGTAEHPAFANALVLPSLTTLRVTTFSYSRNMADNAVASFIRRHGHQLKELLFDYSDLSHSALDACLENLPNVEKLSMICESYDSESPMYEMAHASPDADYVPEQPPKKPFSPELLQKMTPSPTTESCYCPKLKEFRCRPHGWEFDESDLLKFVAARRQQENTNGRVVRLESVTAKFSTAKLFDAKSKLEEMGADIEGLDLNIRFLPQPPFGDYSYSPFPVMFDPSSDFLFL